METICPFNSFSDTFYIIQGPNNDIIYPTDEYSLNYLKSLKKSQGEDFYDMKNNLWFSLDVSTYTENGITYKIFRYLDITKYKNKERLLQLDETTGVPIKRKTYDDFDSFLGEAIFSRRSFSLIMVDIDWFKKVNDTYGHLAGDFVLRNFAQNLLNKTRQNADSRCPKRDTDIVGRIGGEEFLVVLKNMPSSVSLKRINEIREFVSQDFVPFEDKQISITASFGAVDITAQALEKYVQNKAVVYNIRNTLINLADQQLYNAKNSGRNCAKLLIH